MHLAVLAVLDEDIIYRSVLRHLVSPSSLATLDGNGIIVYVHVATIYQYVVAGIYVDGIAARCSQPLGWSKDVTIEVAHVVAVIDVGRPEWTVLDMYIL